jgi:hypothetical protein
MYRRRIPKVRNYVSKANQHSAFDLTSYYPAAVKLSWMTDIRTWYVATYGDRFFYNAP